MFDIFSHLDHFLDFTKICVSANNVLSVSVVLGETRQQLGVIESEHNAEVEELSQQVQKLKTELNKAKASQLKEAAISKINLRESEEENESLRKQLYSIQRSIMANEEVEQQFDDLVDEIIADAVHTNSVREISEESVSGNQDSASIMSTGGDSATSLTLDHAVSGVPSSPPSPKKQLLNSFNGHESVMSLASHGTTQSKMGDARVVARLKRQLSRALQRMETLTNQMAVVKMSCDKIIASIRKECEMQLEVQTRNEIELLNQLSEMEEEFKADRGRMESELQHKEIDIVNLRESADFYQEALRDLEGTVENLQSELAARGGDTMADDDVNCDDAGAAARSAARDMLKLEESLEAIKKENEMLQKKYKEHLKKWVQKEKWLEQENDIKKQTIESLKAAAAATAAAATAEGDDEDTMTSAHSLDMEDISGRRRRAASVNESRDMRSQMKNMRMMSAAGGFDGVAGKTPSTDFDFVQNMHESWSPEGHLGRMGSAELLLKQQEKLDQVSEE